MVTPLPEVVQHVKEGKLRMLATTTRERTRFTPAAAAAQMVALGAEADLHSPEEFAALYRATCDRYRDVVKATGFRAED